MIKRMTLKKARRVVTLARYIYVNTPFGAVRVAKRTLLGAMTESAVGKKKVGLVDSDGTCAVITCM